MVTPGEVRWVGMECEGIQQSLGSFISSTEMSFKLFFHNGDELVHLANSLAKAPW